MKVIILPGGVTAKTISNGQELGSHIYSIVGMRIKHDNGSNFYTTSDKFYKACAVPGTTSKATLLEDGKIELN
jgi:hypothetical protein